MKERRADAVIEAPDKKARERALNPELSFIVQAPAGSGKTTLLIQRYLRLLTTVKRPEEILALTFTRKAAGEMHCRIMAALECAAEGFKPGDARNTSDAKTLDLANKALLVDKEKAWNLLENPSRLRVMTIDSFCASLTCQMPLLSRLGMEPVVTENPQGLYREAARRTLAMVDSDGPAGEAVRQLLRYNDNSVSALEDKLLVMLAKRDQWLRHMPRSNEAGLRDDLEKALEGVIEAGLSEAVEAFPSSLTTRLANSARYAALNVPEGHAIAGLRDITGLPPARADNLSLWKAIVDLLVTRGRTWRSQRGVNKSIGFPADKVTEAKRAKEDFKALLSDLAHDDILLRAFNNVRALPEARYDDEDWKTLGALLHLLPLAVTHLNKVFTEEGLVDFPAVSMAAITALGPEDNPTDLMLLLDNTFSHILVDEYQDTSWTQVNLIKALTAGWAPQEKRTLFIVGDPMQSIYLFRDADVGLFLQARRKGVGHLKLEYLWLESNFRSEGHVVNWVNETFGGEGVFPFEEDVITGAVPYGEAVAVKGDEKARVNIRLYRGRDDAQEAEDVLDIIAKKKENESMAILARSRSHLEVIIAELNKAGIDFLAEDLDPLGDRPVINDLFALLLALSNPVERVAWLALLRARWCGLTLADIHSLCACDRDRPLWELMEEPERVAGLSEDGAARLLSFRTTMRKAMNLRGRMALRGLLEGLWTALGGQALYGDDDSMREAERFFAIVEDLDEAGVIRSPEELARRVEALYAIHSVRTENPLKVMTIHKAKGLEFDHVILPGLGRPPRHPDKEILYWMEGEQGLLLAPMENKSGRGESLIYRFLAGVHKERETLERTRLFYVAATRAAKELYLFGHVDKAAEEIKAESRSFLGLIPHALSEAMVVPTEDGGEVNDEARPPELHLKRLSRLWEAPLPAPPCPLPEAGVETIDVLGETRPVFDWAGAGARHSGTVAHRYLYRIASEGLSEWDEKRATGEKACMEAMLRGLGLNREEARVGAERSLNIIIKALGDEKGRWILGPHGEGAAEYALTGLVEGRIRRVIIDRTFVDEKGLRWVIDYKTGEHRGGDLAGFLKAEKERYRSQLAGYVELIGAGRGEKNIRKGLYYPAIPAWIEW